MEGKFLKVNEVAEYLRCTPFTVYQLLRAGRIPCIKVGRSLRVKASTLEDWIRVQEEDNGRGRKTV